MLKKSKINSQTHQGLVTLNPPVQEKDGTCFVVGVSREGIYQRFECTPEVFRYVFGKTPKPGSLGGGLDMDLHSDFNLVLSPKDGRTKGRDTWVTAIHKYPKNLYLRGMVPEKLEDIQEMEIQIRPEGFVVERVPPKLGRAVVLAVLGKLEALEEINIGDTLSGYEVTLAEGNRLKLLCK